MIPPMVSQLLTVIHQELTSETGETEEADQRYDVKFCNASPFILFRFGGTMPRIKPTDSVASVGLTANKRGKEEIRLKKKMKFC